MPPWGTLFTLLTSANCSKILSAICPVQLKPGLICEEHTSPMCQWPSKVSICPQKSDTMTHCTQVKTLERTTSTQISFPSTGSDSLCSNYSVVQTHRFISCLGGWSVTIRQGKKRDVEVLGLHGYMPNSLKRCWRWLMVEKLHSILWQELWWTFLHSAYQLHASLKLERHL